MSYANNDEFMADHSNFFPSTTDVSGWKTATKFDSDDLVVTKAGLFGAELTSFNSDCVAAGSDICVPYDYADYSGWAIGVSF